jgi:F-type H+-transporting ATPase subunit c
MKTFCVALTVLGVLLLSVSPALAFTYKIYDASGKVTGEVGGPDSAVFSGSAIGAGLGAGLTILGAGLGFGRIGASSLESMARQPEVAGRVQTAMLIIAALLEGVSFFSLIVCILINNRAGVPF